MLNFLKADLYRIRKERLSLVALSLLILFSFLFAYLNREASSKEVAKELVMMWSAVMPLFFLTPAKIFLGEDLTTRTINNVLIKSQNRLKVFTYKWVMIVVTCLFYALVAVSLTGLIHHVMTGTQFYGVIYKNLFYQVPLYTVIASLCAMIVAFFDKLAQSYLVYILMALLFDQIMGLIQGLLLKTDILSPYLMFNQLSQVDTNGRFFTSTVIAALLFTFIYAVASYIMFAKREFK